MLEQSMEGWRLIGQGMQTLFYLQLLHWGTAITEYTESAQSSWQGATMMPAAVIHMCIMYSPRFHLILHLMSALLFILRSHAHFKPGTALYTMHAHTSL